MFNNFNDFIDDIKDNRNAEIKIAKSKGFSCSYNTYKYFDYFNINYMGEVFIFSFFCTGSEIRFFTVDKSDDKEESIVKKRFNYYSMIDLINKLRDLDVDNIFLESMKDLGGSCRVEYKSNIYNCQFPKISKRQFNKVLKTDNGNFIKLIILFVLIQLKSNYYFLKSKEYQNGIYRLYSVFAFLKSNHQILNDKGWVFEKGKFYLSGSFKMRVIRLSFNGKSEMVQARDFKNEVVKCKDNRDALNAFINLYNLQNGTSYSESIINDSNSLIMTSDEISEKESRTCKNLKSYVDELEKSRTTQKYTENSCYTKKPISTGINTKTMYFLIDKVSRKYYLTENEYNEIMKVDPSKSSVDDGSEGSTSF